MTILVMDFMDQANSISKKGMIMNGTWHIEKFGVTQSLTKKFKGRMACQLSWIIVHIMKKYKDLVVSMKKESITKNKWPQLVALMLLLVLCSCGEVTNEVHNEDHIVVKNDFPVEKVALLHEEDLKLLWSDGNRSNIGGYFSMAVNDRGEIALARTGQSAFLLYSKGGNLLHEFSLDESFHIDRMKFLAQDTIIFRNTEETQILKWNMRSVERFDLVWPEDWWSFQSTKLKTFVTDVPFVREYCDSRMSDSDLSRFHYSLELFSSTEDSIVYLIGFQVLLRYRFGVGCSNIDRIFTHCDYSSISTEILFVDENERFIVLYQKDGNFIEIRNLPNGNVIKQVRSDYPLGRIHSNFAIDTRHNAIWFVSDIPLDDAHEAETNNPEKVGHTISLYKMKIPRE